MSEHCKKREEPQHLSRLPMIYLWVPQNKTTLSICLSFKQQHYKREKEHDSNYMNLKMKIIENSWRDVI